MRTQTIVLTGLLFGLIAKFQPVEPVVVVGHSMEPTLHDHQIVLANKNIETISRGDVIVFKRNGETLVKRVAYLPGDTFTEFKCGPQWLVPASGREANCYTTSMPEHRTTVVPAGTVFVMGDNAPESLDSRDFGPVPISSVSAKVMNTVPKTTVFTGIRLSSSMMVAREGSKWVTKA